MARTPFKKWSTREDVHMRIDRVRQAIENEPRAYSLNELAQMASLSPFHFHRAFKATFGVTPLQYSTDARLRAAHLRLSTGLASPSQACLEAGYESHSSFSRLYRQRFGYSPSKTPKKWTRRAL
jgi:AraC-like DNA-binding protein